MSAAGYAWTRREQLVIGELRDVVEREAATPDALAVAKEVLVEWALGRMSGEELLAGADDVDARLAVLRLRLLAALSRMIPDGGPSHGELLALGDASPYGWALAVHTALAAATAPAPPRAGAVAPLQVAGVASGQAALERFLHDEQARADGLRAVAFPQEIGLLTLSRRDTPALGLSAQVAGPCCAIRFWDGLRTSSELRPVTLEEWRSLSALVAGLHAVDLLGLTAERAAYARSSLRRAIVGLVALTPSDVNPPNAWRAVVGVIGDLDAAPPHRRPHVPAPQPAWPSAFALVIGALDRYAGPGGEVLEGAVTAGTWVAFADGPRHGGGGVLTGVVVTEEEAATQARRPSRRRRHGDGPLVPVRTGSGVRWVALEALCAGPRARLFDGGDAARAESSVRDLGGSADPSDERGAR